MPGAPCLGVDRSLTGRRWRAPDADLRRAAERLVQHTALPDPLCAVLARQGVCAEQVDAYLAPRLRDLLPDPRCLKDMEQAATRLCAAVADDQAIAVFADYDVDGGASAALLLRWLHALDRRATLYVPDRIDEGYGPNAPAIAALDAAHDLIICVDCGTLSHDALAAAHRADVVVVDHHLGGETLPPTLAVVNPNRPDEPGDLGHLCAAAVVFLLLVEANRHRRAQGAATPDLMGLLDLVALATVADVAPLTGVNRAFVRQGLTVMAGRGKPGLAALADAARLDTSPQAYHLGYVLGPRINAGGRIGQADLGARLLATDDPTEATRLAARLESLNADRRAIETEVRLAALAQCEARADDTAALAWAAGDGWHPGVVGIVAARLKEATHRPAVVLGFDGDAGKGSARSAGGRDIGAAIQRLAREGLIEKGGGHRMAAGLSLTRAQLPAAMARLDELLSHQGAQIDGPGDLAVDGVLMPPAATPELIGQLEAAGPFGAQAPAPRFALPEVMVTDARRVGDTHLKLRLTGAGSSLDAIAFGAFDGALGPAMNERQGARVHVAGRLEINHWQGRQRVQLRLEDAADPA